MKKLLLSLSALLLLAALVFTGIYFTRFQSMATLQKSLITAMAITSTAWISATVTA